MKNVWYESFQIRGGQFKKKCFRKRDGDVIHHYYFNEYRVSKDYFIGMMYLLDSIDCLEKRGIIATGIDKTEKPDII